MPGEHSEQIMEKLIQDVADVRAGQTFLKEGLQRMENKLDKVVDEHEERIRELEVYKDKQLGIIGIAAFVGAGLTWIFDHLTRFFK